MYVVIDWARTGQDYTGNRYAVLDESMLSPDERRSIVHRSNYYAEARSSADRLNARRSNPGTITRRAHTRRTPRGGRVRVKSTRVKDTGKPGKTPESKKWADVVPGHLAGWKKSFSQKKRIVALKKWIKKVGYATTIRRLNQLANLTTDRATAEKARKDMLALKKIYKPEAYKKDKAAFEKKTKLMLRGKKKATRKKISKKKTAKKKKLVKKATKKRRSNPKKMGSGNVQINVPQSAFKNISTLSQAIKTKTGWPMAHCRQIARKYAKKV